MVAWLALALLAASAAPAAAVDPQPDAAPQAPAVAPDPAPGAVVEAPPAEQPQPSPPSSPPAQTQPQPQPAGPVSTQPAATAEARERPREPRRASKEPTRADGREALPPPTPRADALVRIKALIPDGATADDSSSHIVLLAAGALLALVLASGSMVSVASRAMKGQLR